MKQHLPSIEALTATDDRRLLAELEICEMIEKLARVRALVDRADRLIATVLANDESPTGTAVLEDEESALASALLATLRRA